MPAEQTRRRPARRGTLIAAAIALTALVGALVPVEAGAAVPAATPAPTPSPTATPAATPAPDAEATAQPDPQATATASPSPAPAPSPTASAQTDTSSATAPAEDDAPAEGEPEYEFDSTQDEAQPGGYAGPEGFQANSLAGFKAGNIISDAKMYASGTMSAAQIQSFLNAKVPKCQSGYVCLKDYRQNTLTKAPTKWCPGTYQGAQAESAASIISKAAKACGVNEQVLLVMLQKEQGLVTHVWPSTWRYTIAMGYACPDNAACDTAYYGFQNQMYMAASQLKRYTLDSWFNWYPVGKTSQVRWHPNSACGSGAVLVENKATAALYYYTPYQPNAAALRAGYGTGDSCSSYGNRNFYNYFTDWFGSTQGSGAGTPTTPAPSVASLNGTAHMLAVDSAGVMWAYPSNGKGGWLSRFQVATGLKGMRQILGVGDLNGDGARDVLAVETSGKVWLYPGNGGTGFRARVAVGVDWSSAGLITDAGDFDGDGVPDVFTRNSRGDLLLWRGTGTGGFRAPKVVGWRWSGMDVVVGTGDLNGDGHADVVARRKDGKLFAYFGNGRGGWASQREIGHGWGGIKSIVAPGDFTGDGRRDLLGITSSGQLYLYAGRGDGTVNTNGQIGRGWTGLANFSGPGPVATGKPFAFPAGAGDVNDNGYADVLAQTKSGSLLLYSGTGTGFGSTKTLKSATQWGSAGSVPVTLGDFTGDGIRDLARITSSGRFRLYPGTASGTYGAGIDIGRGWSPSWQIVGGFDVDGDRKVDVLVRKPDGTLTLYSGNGAGGFTGATRLIGSGWGAMTSIAYVGDFDGDGRGDLIARHTSGKLYLYMSNGAGGWKGSRVLPVSGSGVSRLVGPGDFDHDGRADFLTVNAQGQLVLHRGNGSGGILSSRVIGTGWGGLAWIG